MRKVVLTLPSGITTDQSLAVEEVDQPGDAERLMEPCTPASFTMS